MTKTFRPFFRLPEADEPEELEADDEDVPVVADDELEPDDEHAASRTDAMTRGTASPAVCLSFILNPFNFRL
jgi:hypothetical protein